MVSRIFGDFRKWSILTGAGFSANWGFLTSQQVWSELISNPDVQQNAAVRRALLETPYFNYEDVLYDAQMGKYGPGGEKALNEAIRVLFDAMQYRLNNYGCDLDRGLFNAFLRVFLARNPNETGLMFTLNQDMFIEATTGTGHVPDGVGRPGVEKEFKPYGVLMVNQGRAEAAEPNTIVTVNSLRDEPPAGWPSLVGSSYYIKLHGSWDWCHPDGKQAMIMGGSKASAIADRPLLKFYSSIFEEFLTSGDKHLLVVGYGFGDSHINEVIARAVRSNGLRVHIWDLCPPWRMREILVKSADGQEIWMGLSGYTQAILSEVFRPSPHGFIDEHNEDLLRRVLGSEFQ